MEILTPKSTIPQNVSLILGFFDGVHAGHCDVIKNTPNSQKIVVTFSESPAKYFNKEFSYIYPRNYNYKLLEEQGVDYIFEQDFANIAKMSAKEYLSMLVNLFNPISITTGFNHTFGANRMGNPEFIKNNKTNFDYFCTQPTMVNNEIVSSTRIKELLTGGDIPKANLFLTKNFSINSTVIEGAKLGRKLGFPTANMKYPENIVKIPYGVYKIKVFEMPAIMNWGIKPTFNSEEILEVHIPNYEDNLYGKELKIEILSKIRDEIKFENIEELKLQIKKDVEKCLK